LDIVVIGAVMSWENMEGQRGTQLVRELLELGHRVLYIEIDPSRNQQFYDTENFRLANVLPKHWALYDMEPGGRAYIISIISRAMRTLRRKSYIRLGRLLLQLGWLLLQMFPDGFFQRLASWQKKLLTPLDEDLPLIREKMAKTVDSFCRPDSDRLVIFEIPMRCYVECLDIFKNRHFKVVYDLIDKWELMWQGEKIRRIDDERKLAEEADLVTVTNSHLMNEFLSLYPWRTDALYVPNAVRRDIFNIESVSSTPSDMPCGEVTIGYFGNIGEWFDWETVEYLADQRPSWNFVIIGQYSMRPEFPIEAWERLTSRSNVHALGKKKHGELIDYLAHWDLCIIPFKKGPVARATSPVKVYEYLSAYKPVVTFESEEMKGLPYVYHAKDRRDFLSKIEHALKVTIDRKIIDNFLVESTWRKRALAILNGWTCYQRRDKVRWARRRVSVNCTSELCSIILLSLNTKDITRDAVESITQHTDLPYELIVVDNGSTDGSAEMLEDFKVRGIVSKLVLLKENRGYAGGNNRGLELAQGDNIVFINSDIIVSPNWLSKLVRHLKKSDVGAVGPVSQAVGSRTFPQRVKFQNQKAGRVLELRRISGFCLATTRKSLEKVGKWDETFFPGNFDDDDMSVRMRESGFNLLCDGDVFVHHRMMSTFQANPSLEYDRVFWINKQRFEQKWPNEPATVEYPEAT